MFSILPYLKLFSNLDIMKGAPQGGLEITLSRRFFAQITPRNCLKFMFTPSLPNHAGCQIDFSRNHAIIFTQFTFSRSRICPKTPSHFPLGEPHISIAKYIVLPFKYLHTMALYCLCVLSH